MTRIALAAVGLLLAAWVVAEWIAWRAARALDEAAAQAEALSAHPSGRGRWGGGPVPVEDRETYP